MPKKHSAQNVLYAFHLPILILLLLVALAAGGIGFSNLRAESSVSVLGDEDEEDSSNESEDEDEDEDDNDNEDDADDNSGQDNDDVEDALEDENEFEDEDELDDDEMEDEDELEDEDEDENDEDDNETEQTIVNPDGTTTIIKRKIEDDGRLKLEIIALDAAGNKTAEKKLETHNENGSTRVEFESEGNFLSAYPIYINDDGTITVDTPSGPMILQSTAGSISDAALEEIDDIEENKLELDVEDDGETKLKFVVTGTKSEKLLGLFNLEIPTQLVFDDQTGDLIEINETFINKVLDILSF